MTGVPSDIIINCDGQWRPTRECGNQNNLRKENQMIEITITEIARRKLLNIIERASARSIRLIRQGYG